MPGIKRIFCFGDDVFDPTDRFVTSWLVTPWTLFFIRAFISFYALFVLIFALIFTGVQPSYGGSASASLSFSYFTILTYWGLAFYFLTAATHTLSYARHGVPLLARLPRPLQALHALFYSTIICYPFLVTIVFWAVLFSAWWPQPYTQWSNVSEHALNSAFALFELVVPRTARPPWIHLLFLLVILALYLALAFLTHYTRGVYVYSFLDPAGGKGAQAGYMLGIAVGIVVIFSIVQGLVWLRIWVTETKMGREGKFYDRREGGRDVEGSEEVEAEMVVVNVLEK